MLRIDLAIINISHNYGKILFLSCCISPIDSLLEKSYNHILLVIVYYPATSSLLTKSS